MKNLLNILGTVIDRLVWAAGCFTITDYLATDEVWARAFAQGERLAQSDAVTDLGKPEEIGRVFSGFQKTSIYTRGKELRCHCSCESDDLVSRAIEGEFNWWTGKSNGDGGYRTRSESWRQREPETPTRGQKEDGYPSASFSAL